MGICKIHLFLICCLLMCSNFYIYVSEGSINIFFCFYTLGWVLHQKYCDSLSKPCFKVWMAYFNLWRTELLSGICIMRSSASGKENLTFDSSTAVVSTSITLRFFFPLTNSFSLLKITKILKKYYKHCKELIVEKLYRVRQE